MPLAKAIARADLEIASFSVIGSGGGGGGRSQTVMFFSQPRRFFPSECDKNT